MTQDDLTMYDAAAELFVIVTVGLALFGLFGYLELRKMHR